MIKKEKQQIREELKTIKPLLNEYLRKEHCKAIRAWYETFSNDYDASRNCL